MSESVSELDTLLSQMPAEANKGGVKLVVSDLVGKLATAISRTDMRQMRQVYIELRNKSEVLDQITPIPILYGEYRPDRIEEHELEDPASYIHFPLSWYEWIQDQATATVPRETYKLPDDYELSRY